MTSQSYYDQAKAGSDLPSMIAGIPASLIDAINLAYPENSQETLEHLAFLTCGFEGVSDMGTEVPSRKDFDSILACAAAQMSVMEACEGLRTLFGWAIEEMNLPDQDKDSPEDTLDALVRHGDPICALRSELHHDLIPVFLYGGTIEPENPTSIFAFRLSCEAAIARTGGKPCLVLPMTLVMQSATEAPFVGEEAIPEQLLILAGFAFDGTDWSPVTFGARGSDPMANSVLRAIENPGSVEIYSHPSEPGDLAVARAAQLQAVFDRYRTASPEMPYPEMPHYSAGGRVVLSKGWFRFEPTAA